jgi:hypothetical protein
MNILPVHRYAEIIAWQEVGPSLYGYLSWCKTLDPYIQNSYVIMLDQHGYVTGNYLALKAKEERSCMTTNDAHHDKWRK